MAAAGSMLGTKALQIFDETTSVVRTTLRWVEFYKHESCGKCTPCREGNWWLVQMLTKFEAGKAREGDIEKMLDLCDNMGGKSFCALADGAVACVTSAVKHFRSEFEAGYKTPAWDLLPYELSARFSVPATTGAHA
jgi:NADH-quinone oxidoreductase subunit F